MTNFLFDGEGFEFSHLQRMAQLNNQALSLRKQQESLRVQKQIRDGINKQAAQARKSKKGSRATPQNERGLNCPHCGGELSSDAPAKLYAKCRHCASDLFWSSGRVYADQAAAEECQLLDARTANQNAAAAQRQSYLESLSKGHKKDIERLTEIASEMPAVITGAGLEANGCDKVCIKANLRNVSDRILDEVRIAFALDNNAPSFRSCRERLNPLDKVHVSFVAEGSSPEGQGSLWVSFASSSDGKVWEQSLEEARGRPRGVTNLSRKNGDGVRQPSAPDLRAGNGEPVELGVCVYACALLCATDGKVTQREGELVMKGLTWSGVERSVLKQHFVDACMRVRREGESKWLEAVTKTLANTHGGCSIGMDRTSLWRLLTSLAETEPSERESKMVLLEKIGAGFR